MSESEKLSDQVDQETDSSVEQTSNLKEVDDSKDTSTNSADKATAKDTENKKSTKSKKNKDFQLSFKDIFNFPLLSQNAVTWIDCTNFYLCNLCHCSILGIDEAYVHITQTFHKQNLKLKAKKFIRIQSSIEVLKDYNPYAWCKKCKASIELDSTLIQCHCLFHLYENLPKSYQDILEYTFVDKKRLLKCTLCDVIIHNDIMLAKHLEMPKHLQILDLLYNMNEKICWKDLNGQEIKNEQRVKTFSFKHTKDLLIKSETQVLNEETSEEDQLEKLKISKASADLMNILNNFVCLTCNKEFGTSRLMQQHYKALKHKMSINNNRLVMNDSDNNFIKPLDYTKFFLRLSMHGNFESKPKLTPTDKPDKKSKNIAYQEDVKNFGDQYISMCIEDDNRISKSIYRLDSNEIRLLKLGISVIFPINSDRICIPCGYHFPYSADLAFEHLQHEAHLENLLSMDKTDNRSQNKYKLKDLAKSCISIDHELKDYLKCFVCETTFGYTDHYIEDHLKNPTHASKIRLSNDKKYIHDRIWNEIIDETWYYAERFFCDVCNVDYEREISFAGHLNHPEHLEKLKNDESKFKINICFACSTCWYGKPCFSEHYKKNVHTRFVNGFHLFVKDSVRKLVRNFDRTMNALIRELSTLNHEKDSLLLQSMQETVKPVYPDARAYSFGSRFSCLGSSSSDVDVFLDCENNYSKYGCQEKSKEYMKKIVKLLQKQRNIWKIERVLLKTRVPIIKLEHRPTRLKCDISFLNGLGVEKSKLIRYVLVANFFFP